MWVMIQAWIENWIHRKKENSLCVNLKRTETHKLYYSILLHKQPKTTHWKSNEGSTIQKYACVYVPTCLCLIRLKSARVRRVFDFLFVAQNVSTHLKYDVVAIFIVESAQMLIVLQYLNRVNATPHMILCKDNYFILRLFSMCHTLTCSTTHILENLWMISLKSSFQ